MSHSDTDKVALISGATGYIGSRLAQRLVVDGWQVHAIVRPSSDVTHLLGCIRTWVYDGSYESMSTIVAGARPLVVFHLASMVGGQHSQKEVAPMMQTNITFGTELLEAMVAHGVSCFLNTGTYWQHYKNQAYNPVCLYAASKQAFEAIITYYAEAKSLRVITLKLFDTYGPQDMRRKLVPLLLESARTGELLEMSPGDQLIDLVHVEDVVDAYLIAARCLIDVNSNNGGSFGISSCEPLRLRHLVEIFERVRGVNVPIAWGKRSYRYREVMVPWTSYQRLPGWHPRISLAAGLAKL